MTGRNSTIPVRRISRVLQFMQQGLLLAGLCLVSWPVIVTAQSYWAQRAGRQQLALANFTPQETIVPAKAGAVPPRSTLRRGSAIGEFAVPRLKLSYVLLEGTDNGTLDKSIGHV